MIDLNQHREFILSEYKLNPSLSRIAKLLGVYEQRVRNFIKRELGETPRRAYAGNPEYFRVIDSHEKAYFLGFIAGDGCVTGPRKTLTISINARDVFILEQFCKQLGSERGPYPLGTDNQVRFTHTSKGMAECLALYGIGERKSLDLTDFISKVPEQFRNSAILGLFDADGSICVRNVPYKSTFHIKQSVQIRCTEEVALSIVKHSGVSSFHLSKRDSIPNLSISSLDNVIKFYNYVYKDCPIYLLRKHDKFLPLLGQAQTISSPSSKR